MRRCYRTNEKRKKMFRPLALPLLLFFFAVQKKTLPSLISLLRPVRVRASPKSTPRKTFFIRPPMLKKRAPSMVPSDSQCFGVPTSLILFWPGRGVNFHALLIKVFLCLAVRFLWVSGCRFFSFLPSLGTPSLLPSPDMARETLNHGQNIFRRVPA